MDFRYLTPGEKELARSVFFNEIDYSKIRIYNRKWQFFQPKDRAMAPNGNIYYPQGSNQYSSNFYNADIHKRATFIHELGHVWQHQNKINVKLRGTFERSYDYLPLSPDTNFNDLGIEQQAQMIRDYYYLMHGFRGDGWPDIEIYKLVIPFIK
ncbi:hypothetical protein [Marinobacterium stanieri]|uniref:IrrE N-terminal-like domain-containing protein n=1 Tax=Marinobacterium stanieri TaxID=49186 RepID=A0A1N6VF18_9GAMM|nr:hypothetical protein [Marinobacterium stanieri]SIQ76367.1 hypothetical protein SAMN05421647_108212 [Marinobacterium stanieri]